MAPLRTLIIDDEPIALEKLRKYVERTPSLTPVAVCSDAFEALSYLNSNDVDLIITDINMPDLNGLDFVRTLKHRPIVIFITAYPQYAVEGYKVSAVDYLLKPYGFAEFTEAVGRAVESYAQRTAAAAVSGDSQQHDSLFIKVDYRYVRVALSEIRFIKGFGEYLQIFVTGKTTPLVTLSSFATVKECLTDDFLQIHRSYIVNMNHVQEVERNRVVMDAENRLPVGESYKSSFQDYLLSRSIGKNRQA